MKWKTCNKVAQEIGTENNLNTIFFSWSVFQKLEPNKVL